VNFFDLKWNGKMEQPAPYSLSIDGAAIHFGLAKQTLYKWISIGKLHRGYHYLKIGRKPVIIREAFMELMRQEDGSVNQN